MRKISFIVLITMFLFALVGCSFTTGSNGSGESVKTFTVTYLLEDGTIYHTEDVVEGECAQMPTAPEKAGYDFVGWFVDGETFDFETAITDAIELVARFEESDIWLTCTEDAVYINEENTIYFYAQCNVDVNSVVLCVKDGDASCEMLDDGQYSVSGDDLQGDGVYSCLVTIVFDNPAEYVLYAIADGSILSNEIILCVEEPLSEQEIDIIQNTSETLSQTIEQSITEGMTTEEKAEVVVEILLDVASQSQEASVQSESVFFDNENGVVSFEYENGTAGIICLNSEDSSGAPLTAGGQKGAVGQAATPYILSPTPSLGSPIKTVGDAIVLFSFDDPSNSIIFPKYQQVAEYWTNSGLFTEIKVEPTVEDYRTALLNKELIVIAEHGARYEDSKGKVQSVIKLAEKVTVAKTLKYSSDLAKKRIILAKDAETDEWTYCLTAEFFKYYYLPQGLKGSVVYMDNCYGFGAGKKVDKSLAQAFVSCSADAVVGYHEAVYIDYGLFILNDMLGEMLGGATISDALDSAKAKWGNNDLEFAQAFTDWNTSRHPAATPHLHGKPETTLIKTDFINGSFEDGLTGWNTIGDVRVLNKLAEFGPQHGTKIAILTTGIGSTENSYIQGTEGSVLIQSFRVLEGATSLSLSYNVISEEPSEYVGSQYDDKVVIEILDAEGNVVVQLAYESVNTSEWHRVYGIDFEGGDETTYCTYWKTVTFDQLANYAGQTLTFRVRIWDVGDSIYDTAVLLDNIVIA